MNIPARLALLLPALVLVGVLAGCGTPRPKNYDVYLSAAVNASVTVDVIGVNPAEAAQWSGYSMTKYWQQGDAFRASATKRTYTVRINPGQAQEVLILKDAKKDANTAAYWKQWKEAGATQLFILADLPGAPEDKTGDADPRRLILPLTPDRWPNADAPLRVLVQSNALVLSTPMLPPKQ